MTNEADKPGVRGFFKRLRAKLNQGPAWLTTDITELLPGRKIDAEILDELETRLITADVGQEATGRILEDLRRTVRMRVVGDIIDMLNTVGQGRTRDDAVIAMASAYRSYAHHHPGRYSAFTRMPLGGDDPEFTDAPRAAAGPVISVLASYGLDGEDAFHAALEFWSALHGFVLLEMTGVMKAIADTDTVFSDMVVRLASGMQRR